MKYKILLTIKSKIKSLYFCKEKWCWRKTSLLFREAEYIQGTAKEEIRDIGDRVVTMNFTMKTSIRDDIYRYIVEE